MTSATTPAAKSVTSVEGRDLVLTRHISAPRERVFRAWTDPEMIVKWFTPAPWKTLSAKMDVCAGGSSVVVMQSPEGQQFPNRGVFLDVIPSEKLVFTNAYTSAWEPMEKPEHGPAFLVTFILTFQEENGGTRYTARLRHWTMEDLKVHEQMGFHQGWPIATEQLAALVE